MRLLRLFVRRGLLPADDALAMVQWEHGGVAGVNFLGRQRLAA